MSRRAALTLVCEALFLAVLLFVSVGAVRDHQRGDSATMDETFHLFSGAEYVENGTYWLNLEHPPLVKDLAALSLEPLRLDPPLGGDSRERTPHNDYARFLYLNRAPVDAILEAARRPFPWLLALLVGFVYATTRALWGAAAAPLAAGLIALDPGFVAHAGVVHNDVAATLLFGTTLVAALAAARRKGLLPWLLVGLLLGLSLVTKFSGVVLVPLVVLAPLYSLRDGALPRRDVAEKLTGAVVACALALLVVWGVYAWNMRRMPAGRAAARAAEFLSERGASPESAGCAARLSLAAPPLGHFAAGLQGVALFSENGRGVNFLHGRVSPRGFPGYFFAAFLFKSTPAFLLLTAALVLLGRRRLLSYWSLGLLLPATLFFALAVRSAFNIGVRHILPVYPLVAMAGAGVLASALPRRAYAAMAALLLGSAGLSLASAHPNEFSYFNLLVGGERGGMEWFADSNTDWGQDLKRLGAVLRAKGWERETTVVAYSGTATNTYMPDCRLLSAGAPIAPGRYAVSQLMEKVGPQFVEILDGKAAAGQMAELIERLHTSGRRVGRVGSITIWDLPSSQNVQP